MKKIIAGSILCAAALFSAKTASCAEASKPNVVLIVCDELNDYVSGIPGDNGHPQSITPNVAKLAQSSIAFRRAYSNNPSRSSFLTGIYPHSGVVDGARLWILYPLTDLAYHPTLSRARTSAEVSTGATPMVATSF